MRRLIDCGCNMSVCHLLVTLSCRDKRERERGRESILDFCDRLWTDSQVHTADIVKHESRSSKRETATFSNKKSVQPKKQTHYAASHTELLFIAQWCYESDHDIVRLNQCEVSRAKDNTKEHIRCHKSDVKVNILN